LGRLGFERGSDVEAYLLLEATAWSPWLLLLLPLRAPSSLLLLLLLLVV
jgi:hypothetical protein